MEIKMLPQEISEVLGYYDINLTYRMSIGCVGQSELLSYERFASDLERSEKNDKSFPFYFDLDEAKRIIAFSELLTVYDDNATPIRLKLFPVQKFIICNILAWKNKESHIKRFRTADIFMARRNGKSFINSILLIYFTAASNFRSESAIVFSVKKDTAAIVFRQMKAFLDADPDLAGYYNVNPSSGTAENLYTHNTVRVFTGSKDADGFSSGFSLSDETALQDGELFQLVLDGQNSLNSAQLVSISTAGFRIGEFCHNRYKAFMKDLYAKKIPEKYFFFAAVPDENDEISDWHTWAKSNPVMFFENDVKGGLRQDRIELYEQKYRDAEIQGGIQLNSFITKLANIWNVKADSKVANIDQLEASRFDFSMQDVIDNGYRDAWYIGVDLSQSRDLTSIAWLHYIRVTDDGKLVPCGKREGRERLYANVMNFIPSALLGNHIRKDKMPYDKYLEDPHKEVILTTGGNGQRTGYDEVAAYIEDTVNKNSLNVVTISCDPFGTATITDRLEALCGSLIMQSQGKRQMSPWIQRLQAVIASDEFAMSKGTSDILIRAFLNAVLAFDSNGYVSVEKAGCDSSNNGARIDPLDATLTGSVAAILDHGKNLANANEAVDDFLSLYD